MNNSSNGDLITSSQEFEDFCHQQDFLSEIPMFKNKGFDRESLDCLIKSYLDENDLDAVDEIIKSLKEYKEFEKYKEFTTIDYIKHFDDIKKVSSDKSKVEIKRKRGNHF